MIDGYRIVVEETPTVFSAYSPDVPGVGVAAETRGEAEQMLSDAIVFHFESAELVG
jgi:predicted RNase H-like HicB family nuclease